VAFEWASVIIKSSADHRSAYYLKMIQEKTNYLLTNLPDTMPDGDKERTKLIVKQGNAFIPLPIRKIAVIYASSGMNFIVDFDGGKYVIDETLSELDKVLSPQVFFRVNRKVILNVDSIKSYKHIEFGKVSILLKPFIGLKHEIIVSQLTAPVFKCWINSL
jgi:two-component system, LytTR family, response regulator LytT